MRKQVVRICMLLACAFSFMQGQASIQPSIVKATIDELIAKDAKNQAGITKGVEQVAASGKPPMGMSKRFKPSAGRIIYPIPPKKTKFSSRSASILKVSMAISTRWYSVCNEI